MELDPHNVGLYCVLGKASSIHITHAYIHMHTSRGVELDPHNVGLYCVLGKASSTHITHAYIHTHTSRGVELDPHNVGLYCLLGKASSSLGHKDEAENAYQKALAADPVNAEALNEYATMHTNNGR